MSKTQRRKRRRQFKIVTKNTTVVVRTKSGEPDEVFLESDVETRLTVKCKGGNPPVSPIVREEMDAAWQEHCEIAEKRLREAGILKGE